MQLKLDAAPGLRPSAAPGSQCNKSWAQLRGSAPLRLPAFNATKAGRSARASPLCGFRLSMQQKLGAAPGLRPSAAPRSDFVKIIIFYGLEPTRQPLNINLQLEVWCSIIEPRGLIIYVTPWGNRQLFTPPPTPSIRLPQTHNICTNESLGQALCPCSCPRLH